MNTITPQIVPWRKRPPSKLASPSLQKQVIERLILLHGVYARAGVHFPMPSISFDLEGRAAGVAIRYRHIRFNSDILTEYPTQFINEIVGHELAHIAAAYIYKDKPRLLGHGIEWKLMMKIIGQDSNVYHDMVTPKMDEKFLHGYCDCSGDKPSSRFTNTKRNRFLLKYQAFVCTTCKGSIFPSLDSKIAANVALDQLLTPNKATPTMNQATPAQIEYAKQLAIQKDILYDPAMFSDKFALSNWITDAKELADVPTTAAQKQKIQKICKAKRIPLPNQPLKFKRAASAWLNQHK